MIQLPEGISGDASFKIVGIDGRVVREMIFVKPGEGQHSVDVSKLPSGFYNLLLTERSKIWQSRFSKK